MRRGFTLIEVILALALLVALVGGLYTFVDGLRSNAKIADERATEMAAAEVVLDEVESTLATTYVAGHDGASGIAGDGASLSVRGRAWGYDAKASDVSGCELKVDAQGLMARRVVGGKAQAWERIAGVGGLRVRYHVGSEWVTSFDSAQAGQLPTALEISLWLGGEASGAGVAKGPADRVRVMAVHDAPPATGGGS